ncbi:MAG: response regulator transcription factor [Kiritimatiellae bacterium]|jgi:DNA-binding NarL/FixJ family response regulator|nr:response regulator transcription factor [Kiritimatiellia bacterium]NLF98979.1 response regulator transcription factor [Lentisphaerota bacterium]
MRAKSTLKCKAGSKKQKQQTRILLVDDHPLVREGLTTLFHATPDLRVVDEAGSAEAAIELLQVRLPDLAMIDLALPGKDGLDLIKMIRDTYPTLRMIVLSMHEETLYAERVLRAGAHGYIMKDMLGPQIVEAVRSVLRGEIFVSPAISSRMLRQILDRDSPPPPSDDVESLSDRELQVFLCLGSGLSSKEIAARLGLNIKTIQTYREHIKHKLRLRNATDLVHFATQWSKDKSARS